jgi:nucleoside-diphosphate-sugar epimerase
MSTIVLFGATGFVGRNLARAAIDAGHRVVAVSRGGTPAPGCDLHISIEDIDRIPPVSDAIVVHVAAQRYDASRFAMAQSDILSANVALTNRVYGFCAERGITEVRLASSVAVYPAGLPLMDDAIAVDLNAPPYPNEAFYAWSKRWAEIAAGLYAERFGISTIAFRLSNPYGPHDSLDPAGAHVLPAFVMRALGPGSQFELKGDPEVERDFIWVGDAVEVILRSLERRGEGGAYNLCAGETVTLRRLATLILERAAPGRPLVTETDFAPAAVRARRSSAARMREAFGMAAMTPLEQGLDHTIAWYREALSGA